MFTDYRKNDKLRELKTK